MRGWREGVRGSESLLKIVEAYADDTPVDSEKRGEGRGEREKEGRAGTKTTDTTQ